MLDTYFSYIELNWFLSKLTWFDIPVDNFLSFFLSNEILVGNQFLNEVHHQLLLLQKSEKQMSLN